MEKKICDELTANYHIANYDKMISFGCTVWSTDLDIGSLEIGMGDGG